MFTWSVFVMIVIPSPVPHRGFTFADNTPLPKKVSKKRKYLITEQEPSHRPVEQPDNSGSAPVLQPELLQESVPGQGPVLL